MQEKIGNTSLQLRWSSAGSFQLEVERNIKSKAVSGILAHSSTADL